MESGLNYRAKYYALQAWFGWTEVELLGLTREQLETMIKDYLSEVRDKNSPNRDSIYPFGKDAIDEIYRVSAGNHRVALEICYVLFESAMQQKKILIDAEMVRNVDTLRSSLIKARKEKLEL